MAELRVFKTDYEIEILRYACKIANDAHKELMRHIKPNMFEYQMERQANLDNHIYQNSEKLISEWDDFFEKIFLKNRA